MHTEPQLTSRKTWRGLHCSNLELVQGKELSAEMADRTAGEDALGALQLLEVLEDFFS